MAADIASELQKLIEQYNSTPGYTSKTTEQIQGQAQGEYSSYYDQLKLAAQQQAQTSDLALQQQREGLQRTYDKQREYSAKEYNNAYSRSGRQMLSRGMQRSSYGAQSLSNLSQEGVRAQGDITEQQGAAEGNIEAQRANLASQLAAQISQYGAGQAADVMKRMRELEDQEYERGRVSSDMKNQLSTQIYQLMYQQSRDDVEAQRYEEQTKKTSGSGGSGISPSSATPPSGMTWEQFLSGMDGKTNNAPKTTTVKSTTSNVKQKSGGTGKQIVNRTALFN